MTDHDDDRGADALERAADAMRRGDIAGADFHMRCASRIVGLADRLRRKVYDVEVVWEIRPQQYRRELVRVTAGSREIAHASAQSWARDAYQLATDTRLASSIKE